MRVALLGQSGPMAGEAAHEALRRLAGQIHLALVVEAPGRKTRPQQGWRWGFGQPRRRPPSDAVLHDLEELAARHRATFVWARRGDDAPLAAALRNAKIDVGLVVGYPFWLGPRTRAACRWLLNAHPSPLPLWRGPSPLFWWLRSGWEQTAVSLHVVHAAIDAGPVLAQAPWAPPLLSTGQQLHAQAGALAGALFARCVGRLHERRLTWRPQPPGAFAAAPRPGAADGHICPKRWTARALARFCAGARFWVTPSFVLGEQRYFVAKGEDAVRLLPLANAIPGDYAQEGPWLYVQAQDGVIACRVQRPALA